MIRLPRLLVAPLALVAAALLALPAHAQLNLSWNDCGAAGNSTRLFACNTDSSPLSGINANILVGSFVSPGLTALSGEDAYVNVRSGQLRLPQWWNITNYLGTVVGCRPNSVLATTFGDGTGLASCADFFGAHGCTGGTDYILEPAVGYNAQEATIRMLGSVPAGSEGPVPAGEEHYAFTLRIKNDNTVGSSACTCCLAGVTLRFDHLTIFQAGGAGDRTLYGPAPNGRDFVDFNGYACVDVPATRSTWGQIKALYR